MNRLTTCLLISFALGFNASCMDEPSDSDKKKTVKKEKETSATEKEKDKNVA